MLSISEFSEMCRLSPQALRFYHAEGLLTPAGVDEQTGYRSYRFEQVEQAMLIAVLRRTGMSVKEVRRALDEPDERHALLERHEDEVLQQRREQDEAISDARRFFDSWPQPRRCRTGDMTVVSRIVAAVSTGPGLYDWDEVGAAVAAAVAEVAATAESCGAAVAGPPWRAFANETEKQLEGSRTEEGPHWLVKVPVTGDAAAIAALAEQAVVHDFTARDELAIFIPGRDAADKYSTALARLAKHPLDDAYIDVSRIRFVLHDDGVETAAPLCPLDAAGAAGPRG